VKFIIKALLILVFIFSSVQCTSSTAINDFFGIKMPPNESDYFNIVAYTESSGISYQSSPNMEPDIFAWAGLEGEILRVKLVNQSNASVNLNYDSDQFIIVSKDETEYICTKGNIMTYNNMSPISAQNSVELLLKLPQNYLDKVGMTEIQTSNDNVAYDIWKGQNSLGLGISDVKQIKIILGFSTNIILKPVPKIY